MSALSGYTRCCHEHVGQPDSLRSIPSKRSEPVHKDKRADYSATDAYGALGEHARHYIDLLRTQKYNRSSISQYRRCLAHLGRLMSEKRLEVADLDEVTAGGLGGPLRGLWGPRPPAALIPQRFVGVFAGQGRSKRPPPPPPPGQGPGGGR